MKYCNNCKQFVEPQKKFNWCVFLLLFVLLFGWIFYLIYYACKSKKCPMCNSSNWGVKSPVVVSQQVSSSLTPLALRGNMIIYSLAFFFSYYLCYILCLMIFDPYLIFIDEQNGYQIKNIRGFPDIFLEIIGTDNWGDYDEISKKNKQEARRKSGFTAKLKEEVKKLFDYKCALCEKSDSLNVHHIDGDYKNNDKKKLIPLCKKHHYRAERLMCLRCGRELVKIVKGVIMNEIDISELGDFYAWTCKKHPELALRVYHKRKLIVCSLFEMVKEKINQKD